MAINPITIATREFNETDQRKFAEFSSDRNPMHMDPVAARRTQAGKVVVHGVHVFLQAIETLLQQAFDVEYFHKIKVRFNKFVFLDIAISLVLVKKTDT